MSPPSVREHAKHLLLDGVACALVGAQLPVSRKGVEGVTALDNAGSALLIGWGGRTTSAPSAAMLNSSFIQGFELDDYHPLAPLHSNALVLPAMLAAVPHVGRVSGADFLLGAILGYETGPRVGQALGGLEMISLRLALGVVVFGTLSAAASAGSLYGLNAAGFEDALGMAATQSCGLMWAQHESMVKRMQHGFASRNGLTAAALAASGYVGIKRVFEREYGDCTASTFGEGHHPDSGQIRTPPWDRLGNRPDRRKGLCRHGPAACCHRRRAATALRGQGTRDRDRTDRYRHAGGRIRTRRMAGGAPAGADSARK